MRNVVHVISLVSLAMLAGCASGPAPVQQAQFGYLGRHRIPSTARTIEPFRKITPTMNMPHIVKIVGYPDALWGSGLYIYAYRLKDGSYVAIGHNGYEEVYYVKHGDEYLVNNMTDEQMAERGVPRSRGYVPDAATAIRIAEAVWEPIYGAARLARERPFQADLADCTWIVRGRKVPGTQNGALIAEIDERDARILRIGYEN
jgi:hypothetical protein